MTAPNDVCRDARLTVLADRARSASTTKPPILPCTLDVRSDCMETNGEIEVYGLLLTTNGT